MSKCASPDKDPLLLLLYSLTLNILPIVRAAVSDSCACNKTFITGLCDHSVKCGITFWAPFKCGPGTKVPVCGNTDSRTQLAILGPGKKNHHSPPSMIVILISKSGSLSAIANNFNCTFFTLKLSVPFCPTKRGWNTLLVVITLHTGKTALNVCRAGDGSGAPLWSGWNLIYLWETGPDGRPGALMNQIRCPNREWGVERASLSERFQPTSKLSITMTCINIQRNIWEEWKGLLNNRAMKRESKWSLVGL